MGSEYRSGGRILLLKKYIKENFFMTYGDGVCDINIKIIKFSFKNQGIATLTSSSPREIW